MNFQTRRKQRQFNIAELTEYYKQKNKSRQIVHQQLKTGKDFIPKITRQSLPPLENDQTKKQGKVIKVSKSKFQSLTEEIPVGKRASDFTRMNAIDSTDTQIDKPLQQKNGNILACSSDNNNEKMKDLPAPSTFLTSSPQTIDNDKETSNISKPRTKLSQSEYAKQMKTRKKLAWQTRREKANLFNMDLVDFRRSMLTSSATLRGLMKLKGSESFVYRFRLSNYDIIDIKY